MKTFIILQDKLLMNTKKYNFHMIFYHIKKIYFQWKQRGSSLVKICLGNHPQSSNIFEELYLK